MDKAEEQLRAIAAEITAELEALDAELAAARAKLTTAESVYRAARAEADALQALVTRGATDRVSGPLYVRLQQARDDLLRPAEGPRGTGRALIRNLEQRRESHLESLAQIKAALSGDRAGPVRLAPAPKRVAPVIEFDNVEPAAQQQRKNNGKF